MKYDLERFHAYIGEQLKNGGARMSPEQALALWRDRLETVASIRRGLDDVESGRTRPADEVIQEMQEELRQR